MHQTVNVQNRSSIIATTGSFHLATSATASTVALIRPHRLHRRLNPPSSPPTPPPRPSPTRPSLYLYLCPSMRAWVFRTTCNNCIEHSSQEMLNYHPRPVTDGLCHRIPATSDLHAVKADLSPHRPLVHRPLQHNSCMYVCTYNIHTARTVGHSGGPTPRPAELSPLAHTVISPSRL